MIGPFLLSLPLLLNICKSSKYRQIFSSKSWRRNQNLIEWQYSQKPKTKCLGSCQKIHHPVHPSSIPPLTAELTISLMLEYYSAIYHPPHRYLSKQTLIMLRLPFVSIHRHTGHMEYWYRAVTAMQRLIILLQWSHWLYQDIILL